MAARPINVEELYAVLKKVIDDGGYKLPVVVINTIYGEAIMEISVHDKPQEVEFGDPTGSFLDPGEKYLAIFVGRSNRDVLSS